MMKLKAPKKQKSKKAKKLKADLSKWTATRLTLTDKKNNAEKCMKSTMLEVLTSMSFYSVKVFAKTGSIVSHRLAVKQIGQTKKETSMKNLVAIRGTAWQ